MKCNVFVRDEEVRKVTHRYIEFFKSPYGHTLRSYRKMRDPFGAHLHDRFARCPELPVQEFRIYLADFTCLEEAKTASCKGLVTECEVRDALKPVSRDWMVCHTKSTWGYHIFFTILTDMFNHWLAQEAIPGSITKSVITLLKKGDRHVWEGLDDYTPITLLNTKLKTLPRVLAIRLQLVISDLIGHEQNYAVKGKSIQDNLHLVCDILAGLKNETKAMLINLDQSRELPLGGPSVLETAGFKPEFRKWICMLYHIPLAVVQVNGKRSEPFAINRSVSPTEFPLVSSCLCPHFWSPCTVGSGMRRLFRPCVESPLPDVLGR